MADSSVAITQGAGTNIDTRTESTNAHHRQVVVIGDPADNGGVAPVDGSTGLKVNISNTSLTVADGGSTISVDDGGSSLTVDGTVAATQSGTWNITNVSGTVSLPTGAATSAKQDTQTAHLADIETAVELIDDAIYTDGTGTPSKAIGIAGTDGTNPQIISTNTSGHINIADGGNTITVDGTVAATQSGTWNITDVSGTISLPTGAATSAKQDTIITAVQLLDDVVATDGSAALTKGYQVAGTDGTNAQIISVTSAGLVNVADGGSTLSIDDGGSSITVDGTLAVTASTGFPTAVTDGSAASTSAIHVAGTDGTNAQIISTNSSGHVNVADGGASISIDDGGNTITVDGTVTANAGTGFPPVITTASTAGTTGIHILGTDGTNGRILSTTTGGILNVLATAADNVIGRVKLSDGTDVADILDLTNSNPLAVALVDGSGTQITSIGGGTEYDVDDPAGGTDTGKLMLAVRDDALAALTPVDGDYTQLRTNNRGALWIKSDGDMPITDNGGSITVDGTIAVTQSGTWDEVGINDSGNSITVDDGGSTLSIDDGGGTITVDNGGTFAVQVDGSALTALQVIDNPVVVDDAAFTPATTSVMMAGFEYDDTTPDSVNEGDAGAARMSANRNIYVQIRDAAGNERGLNVDASGNIGVTDAGGTITVDGTVAVTNAGLTELAAAIDTELQVDVVGALPAGTNNIGDVDIASIAAGDNNIGNVDVVTLPAIPAGTNIIGRVGHDITGIGHGVTTVTTAGTDVALAASTACKRVIIQAQTDNTTGIAVGGTGVDATIATGTGIFLYPGDSIELEIDNLADVFIDSLTNGEGVRYTYFT